MSPEKTGLINNRATFGKNDDLIYQYTDVGLAIFHSRQWEWTPHASSAKMNLHVQNCPTGFPMDMSGSLQFKGSWGETSKPLDSSD